MAFNGVKFHIKPIRLKIVYILMAEKPSAYAEMIYRVIVLYTQEQFKIRND
jgi:hypothetical protein